VAARQAKLEGLVVLASVLHKDGKIEIIRIIRPLGMGLEENAI